MIFDGTVQVIKLQVPEPPDKDPVLGTETPSDLVAFTATQLLVIVDGEYPILHHKALLLIMGIDGIDTFKLAVAQVIILHVLVGVKVCELVQAGNVVVFRLS